MLNAAREIKKMVRRRTSAGGTLDKQPVGHAIHLSTHCTRLLSGPLSKSDVKVRFCRCVALVFSGQGMDEP